MGNRGWNKIKKEKIQFAYGGFTEKLDGFSIHVPIYNKKVDVLFGKSANRFFDLTNDSDINGLVIDGRQNMLLVLKGESPTHSVIVHEATHIMQFMFKDISAEVSVGMEPEAYLVQYLFEEITEGIKAFKKLNSKAKK